jgi:hypothetical protein
VRSARPAAIARAGAALAATAVLVTLLSGCSGGGGGGNDRVDGTVDEQVGLEGDAIYARQKRAEDLVATCMERQGWDYTPVDPVQQRAELVGSRNLSEEDFNKQFGYGITTLFEKRLNQSALGPNQDTYDALSEQDKALYDRALYGDDKTATFADALDSGDFSRLGGCLKEATDQVFGGASVIEDVTSKLDELDEEILQDTRMVKVVQDWSDCMAEKGYDFGAQDDVDTFLENRLEAIVGPVEEARVPAPGEAPDWDENALRQLQRDEVALVQDDIACENEHIAETEEKVRAEYEREFREQNAALLDRVPEA